MPELPDLAIYVEALRARSVGATLLGEARAAAARFRAHGGDVRAISAGAVDHEGSVLAAVPQQRAWFDELAAAAPR